MNEILDKIFTPIYERIKNPFYSTFGISWCLVNWKVLYISIFLSNDNITVQFENVYYSFNNKLEAVQFCLSNYGLSIISPLCLTLIHLTLFQSVINYFAKLIEQSEQLRLKNKLEITESSIVPGERYVKLLEDFNKESQRLADLDEKNKDLLRDLAVKNQELISLAESSIVKDNLILNSDAELNKLKIEKTEIRKVFSGAQSFIISDNSTKFIDSPTYPNYKTKDSYVFNLQDDSIKDKTSFYWKNAIEKHFDIFQNAYFITNNLFHDTVKEAKDGGYYNFELKFSIPFNPKETLKSSTLHFIVDDSAAIFLNNTQIHFHSDNDSLIYRKDSVYNELLQGENVLKINIKNAPMDYAEDTLSNPYGIIFVIELEL